LLQVGELLFVSNLVLQATLFLVALGFFETTCCLALLLPLSQQDSTNYAMKMPEA
jgi:hypothetical protein